MKKSTFFIVGKHAVTEALKNPNRKCLKIYLTESKKISIEESKRSISYEIFKLYIDPKKFR